MVSSMSTSISHAPPIWKPPELNCFKLNVDASFRTGASTFSVGMVLRNHEGSFISGKAVCCEGASSPLEAEATAILEGLMWLISLPQILFFAFNLSNVLRITFLKWVILWRVVAHC